MDEAKRRGRDETARVKRQAGRAGRGTRGPKTGTSGSAGAATSADAGTPAEAGAGTGRMAHGVEPELQASAVKRLRRIEGQVRGVQRMVEEGRYCADILTQISSVQEALRGVGKLLMRNHLQHCVTDALRSGDRLETERAYGEVLDLMYTHAR